ncbi:helix-turn-helix domain-containing protein [Brevibacterium sp. UCMA 11754]|uniref:helix-turn-helix domain-containing protein n=1 Tax=Brevibacterium sp. UCMA 11754 TaxID=2749198 RepID=UPI001F3D24E4|nr:helix-turn-helix domain-containing protein [Brevibacterium sp. UCMA 11754]MCF2570751.1 helix-turn-helix domain-containing protein [Brevibacterium sp. UCMA 11754]
MSALQRANDRVTISERTIRDAQETPAPSGSTLAMKMADGTEVELPQDVQEMLLKALASVAQHGEVSIGRVPDELTSTVAADMLGISRPTLMKWANDKKIDSFTVGTHSRFKREEVLRVQKQRAEERRVAFDELRSLDSENEDFLDN